MELSAELTILKNSDIKKAIQLMEQVRSISCWIIPEHEDSEVSVAEAAKRLSSHGSIACTVTCRGAKSISQARKKLEPLRKLGIKEILALTGDNARQGDLSIFKLAPEARKKGFEACAAIVFTRENESKRMARKALLGVGKLYTQPVFHGNKQLLIDAIKEFEQRRQAKRPKIALGVLIPFPAKMCKNLSKEKPGFITETSFIQKLEKAESKGHGFKATCAIAKENLEAALEAASQINKLGYESSIHLFGLRDYGKKPEQKAANLLKLIFMENAQV